MYCKVYKATPLHQYITYTMDVLWKYKTISKNGTSYVLRIVFGILQVMLFSST